MRYKVLPKDSDIDAEVAILQGVRALDAAGEMAERLNDVEGLLNVSALWMKTAEAIEGYAQKMEADSRPEGIVKTTESKIEMGFCAPSPDLIKIEEGDELDEETEND